MHTSDGNTVHNSDPDNAHGVSSLMNETRVTCACRRRAPTGHVGQLQVIWGGHLVSKREHVHKLGLEPIHVLCRPYVHGEKPVHNSAANTVHNSAANTVRRIVMRLAMHTVVRLTRRACTTSCSWKVQSSAACALAPP